MKTIETLEQEAKETRSNLIDMIANYTSKVTYSEHADAIISASLAMMTYQLALAEKERNSVSDDRTGLCTLRDLVKSMKDEETKVCELTWKDNGEKVNVVVRIIS